MKFKKKKKKRQKFIAQTSPPLLIFLVKCLKYINDIYVSIPKKIIKRILINGRFLGDLMVQKLVESLKNSKL